MGRRSLRSLGSWENFPKAIVERIKGNEVEASMLVPWHERLVAKNDYLMEIR